MKPELTTRTVEVRGIVLPWERWSIPAVFKDGKNLTPERKHPSVLEDSGEVFVSIDTLYELSEQDRWDSHFGSALLLEGHADLALEQAGFAERETRGGHHRTEKLLEWMKKNELL